MNTTELLEIQKELTHPIGKPAEYVVTKILRKKGQLCRIKYARPLRIKKERQTEYSGLKITDGVFRIGVDYDHTKAVKDKRASGELPAENQGLKGKEWLVFPWLILSDKGDLLARVYNVKNAYKKINYILNGESASILDLEKICLASELKDISPHCFDVKVSDILEIT